MIAIAGGKGGCGKTTITLGLGRALATCGRDPLLVDADVDVPDLHRLAGVDREPTASAVADGRRPTRVYQRSDAHGGVAVVPAAKSGGTAAALSRLSVWHGPIVVDCPAGASPDAALPLRHCDRAILVTTDDPQSIADTRKTAQICHSFDTSIVATVVRGSADAARSIDCRQVESVPRVVDRPLSRPAVRNALDSIARTVLDAPSIRSGRNA